jgi:hypothetical protein
LRRFPVTPQFVDVSTARLLHRIANNKRITHTINLSLLTGCGGYPSDRKHSPVSPREQIVAAGISFFQPAKNTDRLPPSSVFVARYPQTKPQSTVARSSA